MKKSILILLSVVLLFSAVSCTSYNFVQEGITTSLANREYKELGKICSNSGKLGYWEILKEAQELYPECDEIIDIYVDEKVTSLGPLLFGKTTVTATAIQWLDDKSATEVKGYK